MVVESRGGGLQVPLAHYGRLVAGLLQELGNGLLRAVEDVLVGELSVQVGVFARQDDGSGRCAYRVRNQTPPEEHALLGDAI